jgi:hypothetical protein
MRDAVARAMGEGCMGPPLSEGFYRLLTNSIGGSIFGTMSGGEWDYTFTFDVVQVPEPGSTTLLATAFGMLAVARRRRAAAEAIPS